MAFRSLPIAYEVTTVLYARWTVLFLILMSGLCAPNGLAFEAPTSELRFAPNTPTTLHYKDNSEKYAEDVFNIKFTAPHYGALTSGGLITIYKPVIEDQGGSLFNVALSLGLKSPSFSGFRCSFVLGVGMFAALGWEKVGAWWKTEEMKANDNIKSNFSTDVGFGGTGVSGSVEINLEYQLSHWVSMTIAKQFTNYQVIQRLEISNYDVDNLAIDEKKKRTFYYKIASEPILVGLSTTFF